MILLSSCFNFRHFCQIFLFSLKFAIFLSLPFAKIPLSHLVWVFVKLFMDSCRIAHFLKFAIFLKIDSCQYVSFVVSFKFLQDLWGILAKFATFANLVIFVKPTLRDMPLLSSCFNFCQTCCHLRKIAICQDAPFCFFIWIFGKILDHLLAYSPVLQKFPFLA